jgi:hypothetical protein
MFDKKIIVVDDFYPDIDKVRNQALEAEYEPEGLSKNYPGCNSKKSFWNDELKDLLSKVIGRDVSPKLGTACGSYRYVSQSHQSKQIIHFDHFDPPSKSGQRWAGVIYLSLPEHYDGHDSGTKIYSHKQSGIQVAPFNHIESQKIGVRTINDMQYFFETQGIDESKWNVELNVPFKYNRMVLFRPWLWHGIAGHFGDNILNSRLTQLLFLK